MTDKNDPADQDRRKKKPASDEPSGAPTPIGSIYDPPRPSWDSEGFSTDEHPSVSSDGEEVINEFLGSLDGEEESIPPLPPMQQDPPPPPKDHPLADEMTPDSLEDFGEMSVEVEYTSMDSRVKRQVDVPNAQGAQAAELSGDVLTMAARLIDEEDPHRGPLQFIDTVYNEQQRHTRTYLTSQGRPFFAALTLTYAGDKPVQLGVDVLFELRGAAPQMHMPRGTTGYQSVRHRSGIHAYVIRYERQDGIFDPKTGGVASDVRQEASHFIVELFAAASDRLLRVGVLSKESCSDVTFNIGDETITMSYLRSWTP